MATARYEQDLIDIIKHLKAGGAEAYKEALGIAAEIGDVETTSVLKKAWGMLAGEGGIEPEDIHIARKAGIPVGGGSMKAPPMPAFGFVPPEMASPAAPKAEAPEVKVKPKGKIPSKGVARLGMAALGGSAIAFPLMYMLNKIFEGTDPEVLSNIVGTNQYAKNERALLGAEGRERRLGSSLQSLKTAQNLGDTVKQGAEKEKRKNLELLLRARANVISGVSQPMAPPSPMEVFANLRRAQGYQE